MSINYDFEHINEIVGNYKECANQLEEAYEHLDIFAGTLMENYEGLATDGIKDMLPKLKEHIKLFQECCVNTVTYVENAKNTTDTVDKELAKFFFR